jgi:hypothetical protein
MTIDTEGSEGRLGVWLAPDDSASLDVYAEGIGIKPAVILGLLVTRSVRRRSPPTIIDVSSAPDSKHAASKRRLTASCRSRLLREEFRCSASREGISCEVALHRLIATELQEQWLRRALED